MADQEDQGQTDEAPSSLDQDRAKYAQAVHQGLDQYLGGINNLAPKSNEQAGEMALDATPIIGNVRSAQRGYEAVQNHDWLGAALGAIGAVPVLGGIIAGPAARTANHKALAIAKEMQAAGHVPEAIHKETGWWQGPDSKWRFEIPDDQSQIYTVKKGERPLNDTLHHNKLYEAYPDIADVSTHTGYYDPKIGGAYDRDLDKIYLNSNQSDPKSPLLHEIQHAVQKREGFARGASSRQYLEEPDTIAAIQKASPHNLTPLQVAEDLYNRTAGEIEAKNVQARRHMTPEQRKDNPPWNTEYPTYPKNRQIVRFKAHGGSISDGTRALLAKVKRQDGGPVKLKGSFQGPNLADILFSRVKSQHPDMVPDSGTFIPKGGLQKDDPNLSSFRALGSAFRYNAPTDARESTNVEDRQFTHPSLPTSDFGNYDFHASNAFSRPKSTPPTSAAGVQGMSGTQSGPSVTREPWTANTSGDWDTQIVPSGPSFRNGGSITDRTRQLLAKLKNRA